MSLEHVYRKLTIPPNWCCEDFLISIVFQPNWFKHQLCIAWAYKRACVCELWWKVPEVFGSFENHKRNNGINCILMHVFCAFTVPLLCALYSSFSAQFAFNILSHKWINDKPFTAIFFVIDSSHLEQLYNNYTHNWMADAKWNEARVCIIIVMRTIHTALINGILWIAYKIYLYFQ